MTETRRHRALTAARIRMRSPSPRPLLDEARIDDVCAELLEAQDEADALALDNERLRFKVAIPRRPEGK